MSGSGRLRVRALTPADRPEALARLEEAPRLNLALLDQVSRLGETPPRGEPRCEALGAFSRDGLVAVASLAPSIVFDAAVDVASVAAFLPNLGGGQAALLKSTEDVVDPVWDWLSARGRQSILDRIETAWAVEPAALQGVPVPSDVTFRPAAVGDLDALVVASRESLLEEDRPDPSRQDPQGFRRWVRGRIPRAWVGERDGEVVFVGYADVRSARGWLLQGIYTWTHVRREGIAAAGVAGLCGRAFAAGSDHVQLAVVEHNVAGERLYERLGFRRTARLRTLLFA